MGHPSALFLAIFSQSLSRHDYGQDPDRECGEHPIWDFAVQFEPAWGGSGLRCGLHDPSELLHRLRGERGGRSGPANRACGLHEHEQRALTAGTYYVKIVYLQVIGATTYLSNPSPETTVVLGGTGQLIVTAPTVQPASASGYRVYIGILPGVEAVQGSVTGWGQFTQTAPLSGGSGPPSSNNSICKVYFSDEIIPTGVVGASFEASSGRELLF